MNDRMLIGLAIVLGLLAGCGGTSASNPDAGGGGTAGAAAMGGAGGRSGTGGVGGAKANEATGGSGTGGAGGKTNTGGHDGAVGNSQGGQTGLGGAGAGTAGSPRAGGLAGAGGAGGTSPVQAFLGTWSPLFNQSTVDCPSAVPPSFPMAITIGAGSEGTVVLTTGTCSRVADVMGGIATLRPAQPCPIELLLLDGSQADAIESVTTGTFTVSGARATFDESTTMAASLGGQSTTCKAMLYGTLEPATP